MAIRVRDLGHRAYQPVFDAMRRFTAERGPDTVDELWLVEHDPVFTQGQAGRAEHLLLPGDTPVVATDRGGQVTWHGPGQLVVYLLVDLRRAGLGVRTLVDVIEGAVIDVLGRWNIPAAARADAPGVYVAGAKIASLGLRVRRGCSYHGLALNVNADLEAFSRINPCGLVGLPVTRTLDLGGPADLASVRRPMVAALCARLGQPVPDRFEAEPPQALHPS